MYGLRYLGRTIMTDINTQWHQPHPYDMGASIVEQLQQAARDGLFHQWQHLFELMSPCGPDTDISCDDISSFRRYSHQASIDDGIVTWPVLLWAVANQIQHLLMSGYYLPPTRIEYEHAYLVDLDMGALEYYADNRLVAVYDLRALPQWTLPADGGHSQDMATIDTSNTSVDDDDVLLALTTAVNQLRV